MKQTPDALDLDRIASALERLVNLADDERQRRTAEHAHARIVLGALTITATTALNAVVPDFSSFVGYIQGAPGVITVITAAAALVYFALRVQFIDNATIAFVGFLADVMIVNYGLEHGHGAVGNQLLLVAFAWFGYAYWRRSSEHAEGTDFVTYLLTPGTLVASIRLALTFAVLLGANRIGDVIHLSPVLNVLQSAILAVGVLLLSFFVQARIAAAIRDRRPAREAGLQTVDVQPDTAPGR